MGVKVSLGSRLSIHFQIRLDNFFHLAILLPVGRNLSNANLLQLPLAQVTSQVWIDPVFCRPLER